MLKVELREIFKEIRFLRATLVSILSLVLLSPALPAFAQETPADAPMVVFIHSTNCQTCAKVRPIYNELEKEFHDKVQFVALDVSDESTRKEAKRLAKTLGINGFLSFYEDQFPCIGVFKNRKKQPMKELYGLKSKEEYTACIQKALDK